METEEPKIIQHEGVKITKNSKGYTWEIKVLAQHGTYLDEADLLRLKAINTRMIDEYGSVDA